MNTLLRPITLTFRIHRFVVALAVLVAVGSILAVSWAIHHVESAVVPLGCFPDGNTEACYLALDRFWYAASDTELLRGRVATLVAVGLGMILGTPLVAGEIERGTTLLAWSFAPRRATWLLHRGLPLLALLLIAVVTIAALETRLLEAVSLSGDHRLRLAVLGTAGITLVPFGFLGFALGAFLGAIIGRALPTLVVTGILMMLVVVLVVPFGRSVTADLLSEEWREPYDPVAGRYVAAGEALMVQRVEAEYERERYRIRELKRLQPAGGDFDQWRADNVTRVRRVVPVSAYGVIEQSQVLGMTLAGLLALGGTFIVVSRRRPI
jgi:hypothetical protein